AKTKLSPGCIQRLPRTRRMKGYGWFGVEWYVDLANGFVRIEIAIDAAERHRFLCVGELDADQFLRLVHHLFGNARCGRWRRTRRRCWRRRLGQSLKRQVRDRETGSAERRQELDEISSIEVCFIRSRSFSFIFLHLFLGSDAEVRRDYHRRHQVCRLKIKAAASDSSAGEEGGAANGVRRFL